MANDLIPAEAAPAVEPVTETKSNLSPSARNRAAILAELEAAPAPEAKPKPADPEPEAAEEAEPEPEDEAEVEAKPEPETDPETDPDTLKGLDRIKAAEKRMRLEVQKERQEFERERDEFRNELRDSKAKIDAMDRLAKRAKYDPAAVLRALGIADEDFTEISKLIYGSSPDFLKDPKNRDAAAKLAKEREESDTIKELRERLDKQERTAAEKEAAQRAEQATAKYLDDVAKQVTEESALVHRLVTKSPDRARSELKMIAELMYEESGGEVPSERDVVRTLEAVLRHEADELGIESPKPAVKPVVKPAPKAATTTTNGTKPVNRARDWRAGRDEMVKRLETGELE